MRRAVVPLYLIAALVPCTAMSADITVERLGPGTKWIVIEGAIERGDYEKFIEAALTAGSKIQSVAIGSPGGDVMEAMKIGRLIRQLKYPTQVPFMTEEVPLCPEFFDLKASHCTCLSACFLVYAGGFERIGTYIGIHRAFLDEDTLSRMSADQAADYSKASKTILEEYFEEMDIPIQLIQRMFTIPSTKIELLDPDFIYTNLYESPHYEEWFRARCGELPPNDAAYVNEISEVSDCELTLKSQLQREAFYPAISEALATSDDVYLPRRGLAQLLNKRLPFELVRLVGMPIVDAVDELRLLGIDPGLSTSSEYSRQRDRIDVWMDQDLLNTYGLIITTKTEGGESSVFGVRLGLSETNSAFWGVILSGIEYSNLARKYGEPKYRGERYSGLLQHGSFTAHFETPNALITARFDGQDQLQDLHLQTKEVRETNDELSWGRVVGVTVYTIAIQRLAIGRLGLIPALGGIVGFAVISGILTGVLYFGYRTSRHLR